MKNFILSAFTIFAAVQISAQTPGQPAPVPGQMPAAAPAPSLNPEFVQFKELVYDFGNIRQNTPVSHTFTFKNVGDRAITLVNVQASCGCTTPNWKGGAYEAGQTGEIVATFNAASEGFFNKVITITTSEGVITLTITGNVMNAAAYDAWKAQKDAEEASKAAENKKPAKKTGKPVKKSKKTSAAKDADKPKTTKSVK